MTRALQITLDCADPARLAAFWAEALGYRLQEPPAGFASWEQALEAIGLPPERLNDASAVVDAEGVGPRLFFERVPVDGLTDREFRGVEPEAQPRGVVAESVVEKVDRPALVAVLGPQPLPLGDGFGPGGQHDDVQGPGSNQADHEL